MFRKQRTQVPVLQFVIQECVYPFRWAQENHFPVHSFLPQKKCKRTASIKISYNNRKYEKYKFYNFLSDRNFSFNYSIWQNLFRKRNAAQVYVGIKSPVNVFFFTSTAGCRFVNTFCQGKPNVPAVRTVIQSEST